MAPLIQLIGVSSNRQDAYPFNQAIYYPINSTVGSAGQSIIATNAALDPSGSDFTMEFWVWPEVGELARYIGGFGDTGFGRCWVGFTSQTIQLYLGNETAAAFTGYSVQNACGYGEWNHIVVTFEAATRKPIIYINGWPHYQNTLGYDVEVLTGNNKMGIGTLPIGGGSAYKFQGAIGRTRYWKRVLTGDEVRTAYRGGNVGATNLMVDYKFDDGAGTTVTDHSGNGYDAVITTVGSNLDIQWVPQIMYYNTDHETGMLRRNSVVGAPITHAPDISFTQNTPFSISFRHCALGTGNTVIINAVDNYSFVSAGAGNGWVVWFDGSRRLHLSFFHSSTRWFDVRTASGVYTAGVNQVNSYMITYDGSNFWGGMNFYLNGVAVTKTVTAGSLTAADDISHSNDILIMGTNDTTNTPRGYVSDVLIWDQELTSEDAQAITNSGFGIDFTKDDTIDYYDAAGVRHICPDPVRYWPCNINNVTSVDNFQNIVVKEKVVGDDLSIATTAPTNSNHGIWRMSLKYNNYLFVVGSACFAMNYRYLYKKPSTLYIPDDPIANGPSGLRQRGTDGVGGATYYCYNPFVVGQAGYVLGKKVRGDFKITSRIDSGANAKHTWMMIHDVSNPVTTHYTGGNVLMAFGYGNFDIGVWESGVQTFSLALAQGYGQSYTLIRRGDQAYFYTGETLRYQTTITTDDVYIQGLPWYNAENSDVIIAAEEVLPNDIYIP